MNTHLYRSTKLVYLYSSTLETGLTNKFDPVLTFTVLTKPSRPLMASTTLPSSHTERGVC